MTSELLPTNSEVKMWLLSTLQHGNHVEYFLEKLSLGQDDPERPHDMEGPGNKLNWESIKHFALQFRDPMPDFETYILPAIISHRQQYHHQKWNDPDSESVIKPNPRPSAEDLYVGAIDTVCSYLENRGYHGGQRNYDQIVQIGIKNPAHRSPWILSVIPWMQAHKQPDLESITTLTDFPNIGLSNSMYDKIVTKMEQTLKMLKDDHDYNL